MPTIIRTGCVVSCGHCNTEFSFKPNEVQCSSKSVPAGYSPEEEAYRKTVFTVGCPNCHRLVNVEKALGPEAKREIANRPPDRDDDI